MTAPLSFKHYGRGALKIMMPRVISRTPRREWIIHPSFLIFLLSVITIVFLNRTVFNKSLYKVTRTTIILPHMEKAPEPTVPKSLPLIKVLKTAAAKSIETNKKELDKVLPPKAETPRPVENRIVPRKIEALKPLEHAIEARVTASSQPLPKMISQKAIAPNAITAKPLVERDIPARNMPIPNRISPAISPKVNGAPLAPAPGPRTIASAPPSFQPMPAIKGKRVTATSSGEDMAMPPSSSIPSGRGPKPELTQWSGKRPTPKGDGSATGTSPSAVPLPINTRRSVTPVADSSPLAHLAPARGSSSVEEFVVINSKALGSSERVKNLKRDILKKAQNMNPGRSPYTYKVKGYTCTLVIEGGSGKNKVIIDFSPADAPFEVVSALERILPR